VRPLLAVLEVDGVRTKYVVVAVSQNQTLNSLSFWLQDKECKQQEPCVAPRVVPPASGNYRRVKISSTERTVGLERLLSPGGFPCCGELPKEGGMVGIKAELGRT
jgi:hypothetical protein